MGAIKKKFIRGPRGPNGQSTDTIAGQLQSTPVSDIGTFFDLPSPEIITTAAGRFSEALRYFTMSGVKAGQDFDFDAKQAQFMPKSSQVRDKMVEVAKKHGIDVG